jgi:lipid A 3-O-deacylase
MRALIFICLFLSSFVTHALAFDNNTYKASLNAGTSNNGNIKVFRASLQRDFQNRVYDSENFTLQGFHEISLIHLNGRQNNIYAVAYSPVFTLLLNSFSQNSYQPYFDAGIGVAFLDETTIDNRDLSSSFQFEDRISIGVKNQTWDLYLRYLHYSNGSITGQNDGLDIIAAGVQFKF